MTEMTCPNVLLFLLCLTYGTMFMRRMWEVGGRAKGLPGTIAHRERWFGHSRVRHLVDGGHPRGSFCCGLFEEPALESTSVDRASFPPDNLVVSGAADFDGPY
jgi:hypothetical protein